MPGTRIVLPETFSFDTLIPVRITDINYGGHVGNDSILSLIHESRIRFLQHHGCQSELVIGDVGLIMRDVSIEFRRELVYGDVIKVFVTAADITKISFDLYYKLERQGPSETEVAVIARSGMVSFDYTRKKIAPLPQFLKDKLSPE